MWCGHCKQDLPAVAAGVAGVQCSGCHRPLERPAFAKAINDAGEPLDARPAVDLVGDLRSVEGSVRMAGYRRAIRSAQSAADAGAAALRFDPPAPLSPALPSGARPDAPALRPAVEWRTTTSAGAAPTGGQTVAWFVAAAGALLLGAGIGLMGWSLVEARPELWHWGVAGTLGGQGLMIVGLVQLLSYLWAGSRAALGRLGSLQQDLRRLQRTTESLVGARTGGPANFYAELARGSSPQLLLANLKGQVDALAERVGRV